MLICVLCLILYRQWVSAVEASLYVIREQAQLALARRTKARMCYRPEGKQRITLGNKFGPV